MWDEEDIRHRFYSIWKEISAYLFLKEDNMEKYGNVGELLFNHENHEKNKEKKKYIQWQ